MQKPINKPEILQLALTYENHPDNITPALYGGFNIAMINEEKKSKKKNVINFQAPLPDDIKAVVVVPNVSISTKMSRHSLPKKYTTKDAVFNLSRSSMLSAAFITHKWELLAEASENRFNHNGALLSTLSGSGSSFLNICYRNESAALAQILQENFPKFRVLELEFDNMGATLIES